MKWPPFHPRARDEFDEAFDFFAGRSPVLARRFLGSVMRTIDLLRRYPSIGQPIGRVARRFAIRPFPYDLIYLPEHGHENDLFVVALAHHRRRPDYWRDRA